MIRFIRSCFAPLLLSAVATAAQAAEFNVTANVIRVHPLADGSVVLMMSSESAACTSTATPYKHYTVKVGQNSVTADGLRAMQTTAMTAFATGLRLSVFFDDGSSSCYVNRILMME